MEQAEEPDAWKPPYVAYTTLVGLLDEKLGTNPIPPRIDRGFLDNYAGSVQAMLLSTLRTIGLISDDGQVLEALRIATRNPGSRREVLRDWAAEFYKDQLKLADQNATSQMLHESFSKHKITGSTLRKAVVFYLNLVEDVGLPNSPHFKPPRQISTGSPARPKRKPAASAAPVLEPQAERVEGERLTVNLGEAGQIQVIVNVKWLQLPLETFSKLRSVLAELESLTVERPSDDPQPVSEGHRHGNP